MADKRVSELTDGTAALTTDVLPVSRTAGVDTRRVTAASIASLLPKVGYPLQKKTTDYPVVSGDGTILVDSVGPVTITLPLAASVSGQIVSVKNINTGTVTIVPSGADLIDGAASQTLSVQYAAFMFQSDGTNWYIL